MGGQAGNRASDAIRTTYPTLGRLADLDDEQLAEIRSGFADGFVREDRRRLVSNPPAPADEYIDSLLAYWTLGAGAPSFRVADVIAVRGDRLVLFRSRIDFEDGTSTESLVVLAYDAGMRPAHAVMFDPDDHEAALAELDRLHGGTG